MSRNRWMRAAQALGGAALLVVLVERLGTGPFVAGLRTISIASLAAAFVITALATVCCAWRWRLIAGGLGLDLPLRSAVVACYRSQFLNVALPGGVLGDVHRAVAHGQESGGRLRAARAVAWERTAGQIVQIAATALIVVAFRSPVPTVVAIVAAGGVVAIVALAVMIGRHVPARGSRVGRTIREDLRTGVLPRRAWPGIVLASAVVMVGHVATFVIAARTAGATVPLERMLPLAMLVMVAAALPVNIGGWGAREGAAAWTFGAAGVGAAQGVAAATVYGVLVIAATLPGAIVLVSVHVLRRRQARSQPAGGAVGSSVTAGRAGSLEPVGSAPGGSQRG